VLHVEQLTFFLPLPIGILLVRSRDEQAGSLWLNPPRRVPGEHLFRSSP
jgi:hypothetical protein